MAFCKNYVDKETGVRGVSVVFNNYEARVHFHPVDEEYDVFYGQGIMYLDGRKFPIKAPYKVWIPANMTHTIRATTPFLLMRYNFPKGPFKDIPYTWLSSRL
jgi:mannose-6-phosphate isomerase-like protein (cupin superfamily)